jgi:hypothetical protein
MRYSHHSSILLFLSATTCMINKQKTSAMLLLIAVAAIGTIGIGTAEHAFAYRFRPGQNDNNQGRICLRRQLFRWLLAG